MKNFLTILFCSISLIAGGQQFRYGFGFAPGNTWWVCEGDLYNAADKQLRVKYGLIIDQTIGKGEHIAITSGLNLNYTVGGMSSIEENQGVPEKEWEMRPRYLEIPLSLRLRTGQLGKLTLYAEGGAAAGYCYRSRGDFTSDGVRQDTDLDYMAEGITSLYYLQNNMSLTFGAGTEIALTETASLLIGFYFQKGLLNVVEDINQDYDIFLNQAGIHIAGLF